MERMAILRFEAGYNELESELEQLTPYFEPVVAAVLFTPAQAALAALRRAVGVALQQPAQADPQALADLYLAASQQLRELVEVLEVAQDLSGQ
jgi:hypothetical protein